jgi:hypothetical protein
MLTRPRPTRKSPTDTVTPGPRNPPPPQPALSSRAGPLSRQQPPPDGGLEPESAGPAASGAVPPRPRRRHASGPGQAPGGGLAAPALCLGGAAPQCGRHWGAAAAAAAPPRPGGQRQARSFKLLVRPARPRPLSPEPPGFSDGGLRRGVFGAVCWQGPGAFGSCRVAPAGASARRAASVPAGFTEWTAPQNGRSKELPESCQAHRTGFECWRAP